MRSRVYLDVDDVVVDTSKCLVKMMGLGNPLDLWLKHSDDPRIPTVLSNYGSIPLKTGARLGIECLEGRSDLVFLSEYFSIQERDSKYNLLSRLSRESKKFLIDKRMFNKFDLNLSDGVLIDDNPRNLRKSNARYKILFYNPSNYIEEWEGSRVDCWSDLFKELMKVGII